MRCCWAGRCWCWCSSAPAPASARSTSSRCCRRWRWPRRRCCPGCCADAQCARRCGPTWRCWWWWPAHWARGCWRHRLNACSRWSRAAAWTWTPSPNWAGGWWVSRWSRRWRCSPLRVQPGVGGGQHLLRGAAHGPGIGRGVVVLQEAAHRRAAGHLAHAAGADAVGHRQRDAARRAQVARGQHGAVEVLVHAALFGQGVLAEGDLHTARFGAVL